MTRTEINTLFGIKESYQLAGRLMELLQKNEKRERFFDKFISINNDLSEDWFSRYYQEEYSERKKLKQDFTPRCIGNVLNGFAKEFENCCDVCAGIGSLTVSMWNLQKNCFFRCEEISDGAIPILLFNMAIRNMEGQVIHGDSLSGEIYNVYTLHRTKKYSSIVSDEPVVEKSFDIVITNPPYSMTWNRKEHFNDDRFKDFGVPPSSKADYAFVLHGIKKLNDRGQLLAILPHGVLFRGNHEKTIRQKLIEKNLISTIVGLPEKLFLNTDIPVCILEIKKRKQDEEILIIDASKEFRKVKNKNVIEEKEVKKIIETGHDRKNKERYSSVVSIERIKDNEYNLNISRYVDTFEEEEEIDIIRTIEDINKLNTEIDKEEEKLLEMLQQMTGTNDNAKAEHKKVVEKYENYIQKKINRKIRMSIKQYT